MNMRYLFFDVECANCLKGEGKICSFGYVLTDEDFQVLKKRDILINPKAPFLLGNAKNGNGIKLAYPLFRFDRAQPFPYHHDEIKRLLTDPTNLVIGFAADQDVGFLLSTCKRYDLSPISFTYLDVQRLERSISGDKQPKGLSYLIDHYGLERGIYHRSDEDALMTMEILQRMIEDEKKTLPVLLSSHPEAIKSVDDFIKEKRERDENRRERQQMRALIQSLYDSDPDDIPLEHIDQHFYKKTIYIRNSIFYSDPDRKDDIDHLKRFGFIFLRTPDPSPDYYICSDKEDIHQIKIEHPHSKIFTYKNFLRYLKQAEKRNDQIIT